MILIVLLYFCNPTPAFIRMNAMVVSPGPGFAGLQLAKTFAFAEREGLEAREYGYPIFLL